MDPAFEEKLKHSIYTERETVTYRSISRDAKVHVDRAKDNDESLDASFVLTGKRHPEVKDLDSENVDPQPYEAVELVSKSNLEKVKAQYDLLRSIHLYSIGVGATSETGLLNSNIHVNKVDTETPLGEKYSIYGITAPSKELTVGKDAPRVEQRVQTAAVPTKEQNEKVTKSFFKAAKPDIKPEKKSMFTKVASTTSKPPASLKDDLKPKEKKDKVVIDRGKNEPEVEPEMEDVKIKKSAKELEEERKQLEAMFDSDMEDEMIAKGDEPSVKKNEDVVEVDVEMKDLDSEGAEGEPESEAQAEPEVKAKAELEGNGEQTRRKRRKVRKEVNKVDSEGYLCTEFVDVWESCSEDEEEKKPLPAAATKPKVASKPGKASGQTSLMSFFKK